MAPAILRAFLAAGLIGNAFGAAVVTSVEPTRIGYGGGAVTIHGDGFSEDVFNQFDPILGNKVWFANEFVSVVCQTPINWNFLLENPQDPSTSKIVCDLPPRDGTKGSNWFNLILKVDGEEVVNDKTIEYRNGFTPLIRSIDKRYGKPGDKITLGGRFFTKEYGNANFGDSGTVEDRREQSITAVMMGGKSCSLTDDLGNLYGASLDSADGDEGQITCLPSGTFIGPVNGTVFISDKYGKSWVDKDGGAYSVNSKGRMFIYHTLPEVTSISPNAGGDIGGTHITIQGNSFDSFPGKTQVMVGNTPCEIVSVNDEELVCSAPSVCDTGSGAGARGLLYELWKETEGDVTDSSSLDTSAADYNSIMMDGSTVDGPIFNETNGYTARLSGLFVAPYDGDISFYLHSSDAAALYISTDADPANKAMIVENTGAQAQGEIGSPQSDPITMVKGNMYYIEAVHVQAASSAEENFLQISLWEHNTIYHKAQTMYAKDEKQVLEMMYDRKFETQKVTFSFMDSVSEVTFTHAGMASSWPVSTSSSDGWGESFTNMLTYTCEYSTTSFIMDQDYEDTEVKLPGSGGTMQDNVQAYCGARALQDQIRITHSYDDGVNDIDAVKSPYLCFAAMGTSFLGRVDIRITWEDNNRNKREDWAQIKDVWTPSDDWSHQCVNWHDAMYNSNVTWIADQIKEGSKIKVRDVILPKGEVTGHYYIDSVTVSQSEVSIARKSPALANDNVMVKEVTVTDGEDPDSYDVVINPWTCNTEEDDFSLFGVKNADIEGLDTSGMTPEDAYAATQAYLADNDKVIFTSAAWGAGTVTVERVTRGSRAMTGSFTLTFGDKTIELPPYPTDKTMVPAMDALGMIGTRPYYWDNRCFNLRIPISFETSLGGDLPLMTMDSSNLVVDNEDGSGTFRIRENTDGGLMIVQPGGDFFRMVSSDPIITVSVNGFMSSCAAADCSFTCDSALTPELSSVADAVVDGKVVLTISGSGFTDDSTDIIVTAGDLKCDVTAVTASEITCELEAGEAGTYDVTVVVKSKGTAKQPGSGQLTHTVEMEIFSNTPDKGSMGGGTPITVTGSGFPNSVEGWAGGSVTIDGSACKVTASTFAKFTCTTSAQSGGSRRRRASSEIVISIGSASASGGSFIYDAALTPGVTAISPTISSPVGGETLTITGTAFGSAWGQVLIGDNHCSILTWFDTVITCVMPSNSHGDYPVHVAVTGNGYADVSGIAPISYTFVVTDMTPRKGSTLGGTKVKITGAGFGNCSDVTAAFGDAMTCEIDSCEDTEIICTTKKNSKTHQVTNGGRHPTYGPGYVWDPIDVVIQPGDMVDWIWNLQVASDETGISVHQVKDAASTEYAGVGFTSEKSPNGRLQEVFDTPGTYFYSSQPVFGDSLFMKGSVTVAGAAEDTTAPLMLKMQDIEATHQFVADTGSVDFGACVLDAPSDCAADPASTDAFEFTMAVCLTPVVTSIEITGGAQNMSANPIEGFNGAELSIMGSGFSPNMCQNNVMIGDSHMCTVTSNTDSSLVCTVDGNGAEPLHSIQAHKIGVSVANNGAALMSVADASTAVFNLVPRIDSVNVNSGSWAGGNVMVMTGSGLVPHGGPEAVLITFGEGWGAAACTIIDVKFDYISCLVPDYSGNKGPNTETTVNVDIKMGYDGLPPIIAGETIEYTFTDAMTASADSMAPNTVSSVEEIVIEGTNFGSTVKVFLRDTKVSSRRKRRSPVRPKREVPEPEPEEADFVKRNPNMKNPWKCPGGTCDYETVAAMSMGSSHSGGRSRRSYDDDIVEAYSAENSAMLTNIICMEDSDMCNRRLNMLFNKGVSLRKKRAADEEALLEMILLTEGTFEAEVTATTATSVTFTAPALPAGTYKVIVNVDGAGNAMDNVGTLTSSMSVTGISPDTGSIHGGQTVIATGGGFCTTPGATSVLVGGEAAEVKDVTPGTVTFVTPAGADGSVDVEVISCGVTEGYSSYTYSAASSPAVDSISPDNASGSTDIVITGSNFGFDPTVTLGSHNCPVSSSSDTEITCVAPGLAGGDYPLAVHNNDLGLSNNDIIFVSTLAINDVAPSSGSFGGGSAMVIAGTGFDSTEGAATVTVCDMECAITTITTSEINCLTPENEDSSATLACDVVVSQESGTAVSAGGFTYDRALTPTIASISPDRGGTGGGTLITITGSGFGASGNKVMIDGSICDIATEGPTEITCYTNHHNGAIKALVVVDVPDQGYAAYDDKAAAEFYYIDRWSSIWTWGGLGTPLEGEFIVITPGMTILLDVSTPKLKFLLIQGGKLMFDREQPEIELQSEYILIVEGGSLEIGTEEEPYDSKAIITMHGNTRCTELPIFGCKVIGVRNGTLDFHGQYIPVTWTHLADTVEAGDTEITLKQPVTWKVGDHIILATTGDRNSMKENEEHHIADISGDGYTITLEKPLKYKHISISQTFGDTEVESRGEVAVLTRNVLIRGNYNEAFLEEIPACEEEFNSGAAFADAMQTCFAGKFGEELGSDEMGSVIIVSPKYKDEGLVAARIEYTEFTNVGQAFRVGRYPIHFHLPGNMNTSYIRGNAIHHSNNRACTLHDVANMVVERNVAYSIKGLSFFLEDGVEEHNTLQYNLAVFTRMSNSLLNPDINPASFWIVNFNNKFRHNSCAGGTHFCFWLRPANVPDGPSYTRNYCPRKVNVDEFHNNTAHSMGWYGFWIFGQSNHATYDPHDGTVDKGYCNGKSVQARIGSFTTWNNKRGFEIVSGANIRLENQTHMDHDFAAYEIFTAKGEYGEGGPGIYNSIIVGHSEISDIVPGRSEHCTPRGANLTPDGYTMKDVKFYNFDREGCAAMQQKTTCPGAISSATRTEGLEFVNSPNKVFLAGGCEQGMWYADIDGTLTGTAGGNLVGDTGTNPDSCTVDGTGELGMAQTGSVCPGDVVFHPMVMYGETSPSSLKYNPVTVTNDNGNASRPWDDMDLGWLALLTQDSINWITYDSSEHVTNISYTLKVGGMHPGGDNYVLIGHEMYQAPDRFTVLQGQAEINSSASLDAYPTYEDNESGEWYFTNETEDGINRMVYILSDKAEDMGGGSGWRKKRSTAVGEEGTKPGDNWHYADFKVFRCFYDGCIPPPPPTLPPGRPLDFLNWSNESDWESIGEKMPKEGDTVFIPPGVWMVMDIDPPPLKRMFLYGGLEISDDADHTLQVEIILVQGGKLECGTQWQPHQHNFDLVLMGDHFTEDMPLPDGPNLGAKALGIFGFLDMHGKDVGITWTKIAADVAAGDTTIELTEAVEWEAGAEIVISTTSYELLETERRTIASVSGTTITLTEALEFSHLGSDTDIDGTILPMRASVGILSRNVRIVGNNYTELMDQQFGARVLVGEFIQDDITYTGYARLSNVEFYNAGQEGWFDNFDPRYALSYLDTGDSTFGNGSQKTKESYVKKCGFNYGFNSAIGVFASNNIPVEDNVIYRFINNGIFDEGTGNSITGNLVTRGEAIGRIKSQGANHDFYGCIDIRRAQNVVLQNNVMAGCAQAGLITIGSDCDGNYTWSNNEMHSSQHGLHQNSLLVPRPASKCVKLEDFYVWKNYDYGVFAKSESSSYYSNIRSADNGVGFLPYMYEPASDKHIIEEKEFSVKDSLFVAVSELYDCDAEDPPDVYQAPAEASKKWTGRWKKMYTASTLKTHHTGMLWPIFQSSYGKTSMPWYKALKGAAGTYPALRGILHLENTVFANFGSQCDGKVDKVFRTNFGEDDVNFPIKASGITFINVPNENKMYIDHPLTEKLSPGDCTDFDCDGLKKTMIFDTDGSISGDAGTIIPDSAYEWDGDPKRGLGYYRVPKPMITTLEGDRIEYEDKMPNTGIVRDDSCVWEEEWRAYRCQNINHRLMIFESMDRDSKIRRLSPIAYLANPGSEGYIDLVNGFQDHSCCSGYICAERLSTSFSMIATGMMYEMMLSSIPPQNFRFHLLHNEGGDAVLIKMWFPKQQRLDIYVDGMFINPNNLDFSKTEYALKEPDDSYIPALTETNGANYFDPWTGHLYVIVKGPATVDVKTQPVVVLKMGVTVPIENFFEENVVGNLAGLLGIDPANIRVTKIVREGSVPGRKRSAGETVTGVEMAIAPPPSDTLDPGAFFPEEFTYVTPADPAETLNPLYTTTPGPQNTTEPWVPPPGYIDYDALLEIQATITNVFQSGNFSDAMGMDIGGITVEQPIPPPNPPPPYTSPEERNQVTELTWAEQSALNDTLMLEAFDVDALEVPEGLYVSIQPADVAEMVPIAPSITVYAVNSNGTWIQDIGTPQDPWNMTVTILTGPGGLIGETTISFVDGLAVFEDLTIDKMGDGYSLQFEVTYPTGLTIPPVTSDIFDVKGRPLAMKITEEPLFVHGTEGTFSITASLWDTTTDAVATSDAGIDGYSWDCILDLTGGDGAGDLTWTSQPIPMGGDSVTFTDLTIDPIGAGYVIEVFCSSSEAEQTASDKTSPFFVHDWPETGLLRKTSTAFKFHGLASAVQDVMNSFDESMGTMTCSGCPGSGSKRKRSAMSYNPNQSPLEINEEGRRFQKW